MKKEIIVRHGHMHNPPHPGAVLKEIYLKHTKISVTEIARHLEVDRKTISRIVNARSSITAEMALRIGKLLGTSPEMWLGMQQDYDLWQASNAHRKSIGHIQPFDFNHAAI
jgi:addiction module HigA family antidote